MRRALLLFFLVLPLAGFTSAERLFAPAADLWPRWQRHDPAAGATLDFTAWDALLGRVVSRHDDGINRVDYAALAGPKAAALQRIVAELAAVEISRFNRDQQQAYWINLYNALTVKVVLDHYPVDSIRDIDISPGLFADGPWGAKLATVEGERLSLDDIEHRILRPIWKDPRIHYAVNCASIGCPDLMPRAFTAGNTEALLDAGARRYVNHPRGARVADGRLVVSSIYRWFEVDFGGSEQGVIAHLQRHADAVLRAALQGVDAIADDRYDWRLNAPE